MNSINKPKKPSHPNTHQLQLSDQQLSNEWDLHNNRLNFLQQSIAKIQKKLYKFEKSLIILSQSSSQIKLQFRSKLNQMISIVSQPISTDNLVTKEQLNSIKEEIKNIVQIHSQYTFNYDNIQKQIKKLHDNHSHGASTQIKDYVNDRISISEIKTKKFIQDKVFALTQSLNDFEKSLCLSKVPSNNYTLNNSAFSKASSSQNALTNSRSQNKLSNSRSSNLFQGSQPLRESAASKKLTFTQDDHTNKYSEQIKPLSKPTNQNQGGPTNENSSRVVYLREKLKEFQEINKKYDKKELEYESRQKEMIVSSNSNNSRTNNKNISIKKNSSSLYSNSNEQYPTQNQIQPQQTNSTSSSHSSTKPLTYQHEKDLMPSYHELSSTKKYYGNNVSNGSGGKGNAMSHESSARKMDKLKSIKDYLQQTESQIDDSFLQPNYQ